MNNFVERLGITTAFSTVDVRLLEACVRDDLNESAPRRMAVLDPLLVMIENLPEDHLETISIPDLPHLPTDHPSNKTELSVPLTRRVYIDRSDFRATSNDPHFLRFTPTQPVGLFRSHVLTCTGFDLDKDGETVTCVRAKAYLDSDMTASLGSAILKSVKYIQWVADCPSMGSPVTAEVRLYNDLFKSKNPNACPGGWLSDLNAESLTILKTAYVDVRCNGAKVEDRFQFQRVGYFCVDPDSDPASTADSSKAIPTSRRLVFNRTVTLKEDPLKPN